MIPRLRHRCAVVRFAPAAALGCKVDFYGLGPLRHGFSRFCLGKALQARVPGLPGSAGPGSEPGRVRP